MHSPSLTNGKKVKTTSLGSPDLRPHGVTPSEMHNDGWFRPLSPSGPWRCSFILLSALVHKTQTRAVMLPPARGRHTSLTQTVRDSSSSAAASPLESLSSVPRAVSVRWWWLFLEILLSKAGRACCLRSVPHSVLSTLRWAAAWFLRTARVAQPPSQSSPSPRCAFLWPLAPPRRRFPPPG